LGKGSRRRKRPQLGPRARNWTSCGARCSAATCFHPLRSANFNVSSNAAIPIGCAGPTRGVLDPERVAAAHSGAHRCPSTAPSNPHLSRACDRVGVRALTTPASCVEPPRYPGAMSNRRAPRVRLGLISQVPR